MEDQRQPWDRLPEESVAAFLAFRRYRDAGPAVFSRLLAKRWPVTLAGCRHVATGLPAPRRGDAECFRLEDLARLEAIRTGHHQQVADRVTTSRLDAKPEPVDQWEAIARELAGTFSPA